MRAATILREKGISALLRLITPAEFDQGLDLDRATLLDQLTVGEFAVGILHES